VVIGDYTFIAHDVVVADRYAATPPVDERVSSPPYAWGGTSSISIGANAWIGTRAVLLSGARIGDNAIVGAATVVDFDVPACSIVAGNPARVVSTAQRPAPS
jgi:acetyltransferase-like isoleucine patch superfamily enzyme